MNTPVVCIFSYISLRYMSSRLNFLTGGYKGKDNIGYEGESRSLDYGSYYTFNCTRVLNTVNLRNHHAAPLQAGCPVMVRKNAGC